MGWEVGGRFKREGPYIYLWLIHVDIWQKSTKYCKVMIPQLKINNFKKTVKIIYQEVINSMGKNKRTIKGLENEEGMNGNFLFYISSIQGKFH